jgi:hypothetical protein
MTPTTFLRLLTATQAERDAAPWLNIERGETALMRNGGITVIDIGPEMWNTEGNPYFDIIATLDLQATLERLGELERANQLGAVAAFDGKHFLD